MMSQPEQTPKITMNFLFKRENRNRHFQVIVDNGYLGMNRVYTGLGLYKTIHECSRLMLQKYSKEFRDDFKNRDYLLKEQINNQIEFCKHIMIGKNKNAKKNSRGEVIVQAGWELEL